jgi:uracil-DNA glycosylase
LRDEKGLSLEAKERIDIFEKQIDIIHKKILILLGAIAGSWIYGLKFSNSENILTYFFGVLINWFNNKLS